MPVNILRTAQEAGARFVGIDPVFNETYSVLNAEWIPCHPGSDTALLLGVAHEMLAQDDNGSLIDWDFLDRCVLGFDAEHMPGGRRPEGKFQGLCAGNF